MNIIKVEFKKPLPPTGERVFYFSSMKTIFDKFDKVTIGIGYPWLLKCGLPKTTSKCTITRHQVFTSKENNYICKAKPNDNEGFN